jgi:hypothetical protein
MNMAVDEPRFGTAIERDLDSNGVGPFDCYLLRYPCGLEVALGQFITTARSSRSTRASSISRTSR